MKNLFQPLHHEGTAEQRAKKAIQVIQKWVEDNYPVLASVSKSKLIIECLIEVTEERKFQATR